ncbi:MAG: hypothetical protein AAF497_15795, partial [Planctomycetota bacterium]
LPSRLVTEILGDDSEPSTITASWELSEENTHLQLFDLNVDGVQVVRRVSLPIERAGPIRLNLGSQQYNVFPSSSAKDNPSSQS